MNTRKYYFDHASTTYIYQEVLDQFRLDLEESFANPASIHRLGRDLSEKIEETKDQFISLIGGRRGDQFYFLSSATEANNTIIRGLNYTEEDEVLYTCADHPSVTLPVENLNCKKIQIDIHQNGTIDIEKLQAKITNKSKLIVLSLVNNQSGNIHSVNEIAKIIKSINKTCHVHVDAVQGLGKINYKIINEIDSLAFSGHKIGAPKGIAGLFIKKEIAITPLIIGGGQQNNFRAGTENFPLYNAFFLAFKISQKKYLENFERIKELSIKLKKILEEKIEGIIFPFSNTTPFIITFIVPNIPSDVLIRLLETKMFYLSSSSACSSKIKAFNSVFDALKIDEKFHKNVVRFSINYEFDEHSLYEFASVFTSVYQDLSRLSKK